MSATIRLSPRVLARSSRGLSLISTSCTRPAVSYLTIHTPCQFSSTRPKVPAESQFQNSRTLVSETKPATGRLANKVAIVTGASSGIGRAIALQFAREGAKVVCSDLQPLAKVEMGDESKIATHDAISKEGGVGVFVKADVGEASEVEELVNQGVEIFGRVDIFVNNAGIAIEGENPSKEDPFHVGVHVTPISTWDKTQRINARGTFLGCKYAITQMLKQEVGPSGSRGWIINMASVAGLVGISGAASYAASKGAVVNLTRQIGVDYGRDKIHCNAICPGFITTAMVKPLSENKATAAALAAAHPWGSFGVPKDIATAAVFLASDDASFVTGALLPVDGGYVAQ